MANFDRGRYVIYQSKEISGDSALSPVSPKNEIAVSNHDTGRSVAALAVGGLVVNSAIGAIRSEIEATTGNEILQSNINNTLLGLGYSALLLKGGAIAAIGLAVKGVTDEVLRQRSIYRQNVAISFENKLKGRRISGGDDSVYY